MGFGLQPQQARRNARRHRDRIGRHRRLPPGVGTPVLGGATYRETHLAMEMICDSSHVLSMEGAEVSPVILQFNRTAELAVKLILSALGKKIL